MINDTVQRVIMRCRGQIIYQMFSFSKTQTLVQGQIGDQMQIPILRPVWNQIHLQVYLQLTEEM